MSIKVGILNDGTQLLADIKEDRKVSIEEVVVAEEKVVFKLPKELN